MILRTGLLLLWSAVAVLADDRPNIMVIVTDDQSPLTLSCYGGEHCETPSLDRLAASGMVLDQMYHMGSMSGAVCTPSRTMIMSGRTLWHLPSRGRKAKNKSADSVDGSVILNHTMPAVFNRAGYDTFRTCKKGNSYSQANALFATVRDKSCRKAGDDDGSQWHGRQVLEFLRAREESGEKRPFLIYFGFSHPHDPRVGREDLLAKYGAENRTQPPTEIHPKSPPLPITWLPEHPFHHGHPGLRDEVKVPGVLTSRTEATIRNELGREYACIENVDEQIGKVLDRLDEIDELENTYVIFTSDHGISVGRHGLTGKQNLYEHTWRVPFLVTGPGIQPSSRGVANGYLLDILPTICELAGIEIPQTAEGKSLKLVLMGKQETVRDVLYGCYCGGTKPGMRSVRKGDWKLIKYDTMDGTVRETQLFHLAQNPHELLIEHHAEEVVARTGHTPSEHEIDLAESPDHASKLAEMEALLLREMERLDDPYRLWDQPPLSTSKQERSK
ncbi:MAG: sulfatase-like hydrolase/transferase [Planctomycetota bacterium]